MLAAHSGLVQYGRNNIDYVSEIRSSFQLVSVYSDMPCQVDSWQDVTMMESCEECELCRLSCPSRAITSDRVLLQVERCIVYHNEKKVIFHFPNGWILLGTTALLDACVAK